MHAMRKASKDGHNAKLRRMTSDYGSAAGPAENISAPANRRPNADEAVGFGADESPKSRSDRAPRRSPPVANPVATLATGGGVPARAAGGRAARKPGATNVNVIVVPGAAGGPAGGAPVPALAAQGAPPPGLPPTKPPMMPGMGGASPPGAMPPGAVPPGIVPPRARGGSVKHPDEAEDRALVNEMLKEKGITKRASGGKVSGYDAGAMSGEGRLQKIENYGRRESHRKPQVV